MPRTRFTFERPDDIRGNPAAIEASGLRLRPFAGDEACDPARIERYIVFQAREACPRARVTPGYRHGWIRSQRPINGRAFPFAYRIPGRTHQVLPRNVLGRQVKSWRARRFQNAEAPVGTCYYGVPVPNLDPLAAILDGWRARIIPH